MLVYGTIRLERHNLEMEIIDAGGFKMVQVAKEGSRVASEGSIRDMPLPEGVGSTPCNAVSGQTLDASFPDGSNLEINQMF